MKSVCISESWASGHLCQLQGEIHCQDNRTDLQKPTQIAKRWLRRAALPQLLRAKRRRRKSTSSPRKWSSSVPATRCSACSCGESTIRWVRPSHVQLTMSPRPFLCHIKPHLLSTMILCVIVVDWHTWEMTAVQRFAIAVYVNVCLASGILARTASLGMIGSCTWVIVEIPKYCHLKTLIVQISQSYIAYVLILIIDVFIKLVTVELF